MANNYLRCNSSTDVVYWTTSTAGGDYFYVMDLTTDVPAWKQAGSIGANDRIYTMDDATDVPDWD